jgi:beta-phosphoglucomutase family hydrolase
VYNEKQSAVAAGLALIFDMDGVLVDSNPLHREAWEAYNLQYGIETGEDKHRQIYGRRNDDIVRDLFGPDLTPGELAAHGRAKEALFREMMAGSLERALVPGIREFLESVAGIRMAVATNAERANLDFVLDGTGLRPYFAVAVDGHQVSQPKPDPEIYLRTAELLECPPANCIVFEDSEAGVAAALAAGMRTVGVATTDQDLAGVNVMIRDFRDEALGTWLRRQEKLV